jgi:hypothetical protein
MWTMNVWKKLDLNLNCCKTFDFDDKDIFTQHFKYFDQLRTSTSINVYPSVCKIYKPLVYYDG